MQPGLGLQYETALSRRTGLTRSPVGVEVCDRAGGEGEKDLGVLPVIIPASNSSTQRETSLRLTSADAAPVQHQPE
jgi:hypothetical protein